MQFWDQNIPGIKSSGELALDNYVTQFGVPPNRIDLLNEIEGVEFSEAWKEKNTEMITIKNREVPVYFIGLEYLILNKEKAGRNKDKEDLKFLKKIK